MNEEERKLLERLKELIDKMEIQHVEKKCSHRHKRPTHRGVMSYALGIEIGVYRCQECGREMDYWGKVIQPAEKSSDMEEENF